MRPVRRDLDSLTWFRGVRGTEGVFSESREEDSVNLKQQ